MVSLYEILQVPPTATKDEIKKAYKSMALKTHPDRVPPEQKSRAAVAFQKVNAAYEVLSNDSARQDYDMTGRIPPNAALGTSSPAPSSSSSSSSTQAPPFFNHFPPQPFGFGPESFFNDHHEPFGAHFNTPFFNSAFSGTWDPFINDPFFNPSARRAHQSNGFGNHDFPQESLFRNVEDVLQDFVQQTGSNAFGGRMHGNSLFDPPPFPFPSFGPMSQQRSLPQSHGNNGRRSESSTFFSSSTSTYRDGKWVTEAYEESNVNGERKSRRGWVHEDGVQHVEERRPDGSSRHLRNGVEQRGVLPPPPSYTSERGIRDTTSSRRRRE